MSVSGYSARKTRQKDVREGKHQEIVGKNAKGKKKEGKSMNAKDEIRNKRL